MKWIAWDRHQIRLLGIQYRSNPVRCLTVGLWFGKIRWDFDQ